MNATIVIIGPEPVRPLADLLIGRFLPGICRFEPTADVSRSESPMLRIGLPPEDLVGKPCGFAVISVMFRAFGYVTRRKRRTVWDFPEPDPTAKDFRKEYALLCATLHDGGYMLEMDISAVRFDDRKKRSAPFEPFVFRQEVCLRDDVSDEEFRMIRNLPDRGAYPFPMPFGGMFETLCCAPDLIREIAADEIFKAVGATISEARLDTVLVRREEEDEPSHGKTCDGYYL